jgi:cell division septum initiation protein DivIVA
MTTRREKGTTMTRREREIERLRERLAELDAELERGWEIAAEVAERDEIAELAEMAEESALSELGAFGCIEFEPQVNWDEPADTAFIRWMVENAHECVAAELF